MTEGRPYTRGMSLHPTLEIAGGLDVTYQDVAGGHGF